MTEQTLKSAQEEFIFNAEMSWEKIKNGDAKAANKVEKQNEQIVSHWTDRGMLENLLLPLLMHNSSKIKYAAAAYLVNSDAKEKAIAVLRELSKEPTGLVSPAAKAVLRAHKIALEG